MTKTALVFGGTGLVGKYLIKLLCKSEQYVKVVSFSRKPCGYSHPILTERISELDNLAKISGEIIGHDLFCCLGTTIEKAGSKENFRKVDFYMPVELATIASNNKIQNLIVVSSIGADDQSASYYLRTKGKMEIRIMQCAVPKISIVRPSILLGPRKEFRFGEEVGKFVMKLVSPLMLGKFKKYRGIHAETVAMAMLAIASNDEADDEVYESDELVIIAKGTRLE